MASSASDSYEKFFSLYCCHIIYAGLKNGIVVTASPYWLIIISILLSKHATTVKCDGTGSELLWPLFSAIFAGFCGWCVLGASSFQCWKVIKAKLEVLFKGTYSLCWAVRVYLLLLLVPVRKDPSCLLYPVMDSSLHEFSYVINTVSFGGSWK